MVVLRFLVQKQNCTVQCLKSFGTKCTHSYVWGSRGSSFFSDLKVFTFCLLIVDKYKFVLSRVGNKYMLIPKWEQTLFWNGDSPNGNFLVCLPVSTWGSPYGNGNPHMNEKIFPNGDFFLNPQMGMNSVLEWASD